MHAGLSPSREEKTNHQPFCRGSSTELHVGTQWPREEGRGDRGAAEAVVINQEKDQQHNPIDTTIGFAIDEIEEHGGSDVVTSVVPFLL